MKKVFIGMYYLCCLMLGMLLGEMGTHYVRGNDFWDVRGAVHNAIRRFDASQVKP